MSCPKCGECAFFVSYSSSSDYGQNYGDCRFSPPYHTHDSRNDVCGMLPEESGWPTMHKDDVACGKYKKMPKLESGKRPKE